MKIKLYPKEKRVEWVFDEKQEQEQLMVWLAGMFISTGQFVKEPGQLDLPLGVEPETIIFIPKMLDAIPKQNMFQA